MNRVQDNIKQRLSLREPLQDSLDIVAQLCQELELKKEVDLEAELEKVKAPAGLQLKSIATAISMNSEELMNINKHRNWCSKELIILSPLSISFSFIAALYSERAI